MPVPMIETVDRQALMELTYKELKSLIDPDYLKAAERTKVLRGKTRLKKIKGNSLLFSTTSSNYAKNGCVYEQEVKLFDLADALKTPNKSLKDRALMAIHGNVGLRCTCPAFVYWGFGYILFYNDAAAPGKTLDPNPRDCGCKGPLPPRKGRKKRRYKCSKSRRRKFPAPVDVRPKYYGKNSPCNRNYKMKGIMCKHLGHVMEVVGAYWNTLRDELKKQGHE